MIFSISISELPKSEKNRMRHGTRIACSHFTLFLRKQNILRTTEIHKTELNFFRCGNPGILGKSESAVYKNFRSDRVHSQSVDKKTNLDNLLK